MDCLAQELIDEIIDHVPHDHMRWCSLVARSWRRRSQQRHFGNIWLTSEARANRWYTRISQKPEGIPSYVRFAQFNDLTRAREPGMFNHILRCFVNLRSLRLIRVELSLLSKRRDTANFGNFGGGVTRLCIDEPVCTYDTFFSFILSFPNLQSLILFNSKPIGILPPALPKAPKRVLKELWIYGGGSEVTMALGQCQLSFQVIMIRRLPHLKPQSGGLPALLSASSGVVEKFALRGGFQSSSIQPKA